MEADLPNALRAELDLKTGCKSTAVAPLVKVTLDCWLVSKPFSIDLNQWW